MCHSPITPRDIENDIGPAMDACPVIRKLRAEIRDMFRCDDLYQGVPDHQLPPQIHVGPIPEIDLVVDASNPLYGIIAVDPAASDRCTVIETILVELQHLKNRSEFIRLKDTMCHIARDTYIRRMEELEFQSVRGAVKIWKQCAAELECDTMCPTYGDPDTLLEMTFDDYFRCVTNDHKEFYGREWDACCR